MTSIISITYTCKFLSAALCLLKKIIAQPCEHFNRFYFIMGGSGSTFVCHCLNCHKSRTAAVIVWRVCAVCSAICPRLYRIAAGLAVLVLLFYCFTNATLYCGSFLPCCQKNPAAFGSGTFRERVFGKKRGRKEDLTY